MARHPDAQELFRSVFNAEPDGEWFAPGRVNLIGEHLDYNGGKVLPFALGLHVRVALRKRDDNGVRLVSTLGRQVWESDLEEIRSGKISGWVAYVAGVAWALGSDFGFDAAVDSNVPLGAGLSSSAALSCASAFALTDPAVTGKPRPDLETLVEACIRAENDVVGAATGGMDQSASIWCEEDHALLIDFGDASRRQIPLPLAEAGLEVLIIDTRAHHSLADGQYETRRRGSERAARLLGHEFLAQATADEVRNLPDELQPLARHVVSEEVRVDDVVELCDAGDFEKIGPLLTQSHYSLRDDYRVSCAELDVAVEAALGGGALGARMTGGGFGGSAIALCRAGERGKIEAAVDAAYREHGFEAPEYYLGLPARGAHRVS